MQKQLDHLNKVKLFEAVQGVSEPIRSFIHSLKMLAYKCNFTTNCPSKNCTAANYRANILLGDLLMVTSRRKFCPWWSRRPWRMPSPLSP